MKKIITILCIAVMALSLFAGCGQKADDNNTAAAGGTVSTDGSTSMEKVIGALGESFMEANSGTTFTYNPTGSGSGIQAVSEGRCDIGLSSRALKDDEKASGLKETTLALDGIAIIVNPQNPVKDLTLEQIAKIYTGEITNWKDVGGNDAEIVLIGREAGSGTRDGFESITDTKDACQYRQELTSTGDVITTVSQNPNAIGYASLAAIKDSVKALTVNGVAPTEATVKDGTYLVQRPFVLVPRPSSPRRAQSRWPEPQTSVQAAGDQPPFAYTEVLDMKKRSQVLETVVHGVFLLLGLITVGCVLLISVYLIVSGIPAIQKIGLVPFLFGKTWASTAAEPSYGILPFILTSVYGTAGAIVLGVPLGFLTAVYLAKVAPPRLKTVLESAVSLLAGIPSVVYGLVGMLVLVPGIRKVFHLADGASLLAAIVVLAIMILPSIIKVSVTALEAVPPEYEDASLALGATPIETYFKVSVPAAKSGIAAAVVLGVGRAIGEAMAVMMVSGNVPNMPSLFQSVRFLTTAVASEMSYSSGLQRQALFSIALVLFLFIMLINATLNFFLKRNKEGDK